jgi:hypothetical protein
MYPAVPLSLHLSDHGHRQTGWRFEIYYRWNLATFSVFFRIFLDAYRVLQRNKQRFGVQTVSGGVKVHQNRRDKNAMFFC